MNRVQEGFYEFPCDILRFVGILILRIRIPIIADIYVEIEKSYFILLF